jgi:ribosome-binding protein aMBF1 (putative translation factor)
MKIGLAIRSARRNINLSVVDLASRVGVQPSVIRQIEKKELVTSLQLTQNIAKVLGFRVSQLVTVAESIVRPEDEIKNLQRRLLLSVQPILFQIQEARPS